ncbi:MAG: fimbrillin family protein [Bacteroides sp.]|nr:fimbrillin family protein [Bacteroides sp.]
MRTLNKLFYLAALATGLLMSCNDDDKNEDCFGKNPVNFTSNISSNAVSRASGTQWGVDAIGVYMKKAGETLDATSILDDAKNKKYTTTGDGKFVYATPEDMIYFPDNGDKVDFIAYYPYQEELTTFTYPVNVSDQSKPEEIDLLYSSNAVELSKESTVAELKFDHMLTNLVLNVKDETGQGLSGMAVTISGMPAKADFSLADGTLTADAASAQNISAVVAAEGNNASVSAILLPVTTSNNKVTFQLSGRTYIWEMEDGIHLDGKNRYTFEINLRSDGTVDVLNPQGSINDWINNNGGTVNLGDGDGGEDPGPGPGNDLEFYETFGTGEISSSARPKIAAYTEWDMQSPIAYSDSYDRTDLRTVSSYGSNLNRHLWFTGSATNTYDCEFVISGIESGYTNMKLSYDIATNTLNGSSAGNIQIYCNGTLNTEQATGSFSATNSFIEITDISIPDNTTEIRFFSDHEINKEGYRLDNIKITGTK